VLIAMLSTPSCRSGSDRDPDPAPTARAGGEEVEPEPRAPAAGASGLTAEQRLRADRLINNFEHGTTEFLYGSAEVLPDGRGITFGRAGFTTRSGDGHSVIERYTAAKPENPLARYRARL
jgi:chitosanase